MDWWCGENFTLFLTPPDVSKYGPEISSCAHKTLFTGVPTLLTWLMSLVLVHKLWLKSDYQPPGNESGARLKCTILMGLKLLAPLLLVCSTLCDMALSLFDHVRPVDVLHAVVLVLTFLWLFFLTLACKRRGVITSGVLWCSYLAFVLAGVSQLIQSLVRLFDTKTPHTGLNVIFIVHWCLLLVAFVLHCFADSAPPPPDDTLELKDAGQPLPQCPEYRTSFFNQLTWWWFTPLAVSGHKRPLESSDLWQLNQRDKSDTLVPQFRQHWNKALEAYEKRKREQKAKLKHEREAMVGSGSPTLGPGAHEMPEMKLGPSEVGKPIAPDGDCVQVIAPTRWPLFRSRASKVPKVPEPSVLFVLFRCVYGTLLPAAALKLIFDLLQFVGPQILNKLIGFTEDPSLPMWQGFFWTGVMFLVSILQSMVLHQYFHRMFRIGMNVKTTLVAAVFEKCLLLSAAARKERTVGEIVNLMSVDVQRFQDITNFLMLYVSAPLQIILSLVFLWQILGPAVLGGLVVMILTIPINFVISVKMRKLQSEQMKYKDDRIKMMNEILNGMKVLKLNAWEPSMEQRVLEIRSREINILKKIAYLNAVTTLTWASAPFLVAVVSFAAFTLSDPEHNVLTPTVTFVSLSLFNILRFPMSMLSMVIGQTVQVSVSNTRLRRYLAAEQLDFSVVTRLDPRDSSAAITITDATFTWDTDTEGQAPSVDASDTAALRDINVKVDSGQLVAVVGKVGSGKSSLLAAILGEMSKKSGNVLVSGSIAYVPQQAWIQNKTLRDNILFGEPLDQEWYDSVVEACALKPDLEVLPAGDRTEIGEKGINLSGGQRQRVALARAVYSKRGIYLFDDPLSAVDSHVSKHIFQKVLSGTTGLLRGKTRILVTHGLHLLKHCDKIMVIGDGTILETGTLSELLARDGVCAQLLMEHALEHVSSAKVKRQRTLSSANEPEDEDEGESDDEVAEVIKEFEKYDPNRAKQLARQISTLSRSSGDRSRTHSGSGSPAKSPRSSNDVLLDASAAASKTASRSPMRSGSPEKKTPKPAGPGGKPGAGTTDKSKLIQLEASETGKVKIKVYMMYLRAIGLCISVAFFLVYIVSSVCGVSSNLWLADWSDRERAYMQSNRTGDPPETNLRLVIYTALGMSQAFLVFVAAILLALGMVSASRRLHANMLHQLLRAPMAFYDVTPLGRILNRCGKDVDTLDTTMPGSFRSWIFVVVSCVSAMAVILVAYWAFAIALPPLFLLYIAVLVKSATVKGSTSVTIYQLQPSHHSNLYVLTSQRFYVSTSRQLKRIESVSRSPIYSHFQEAVQGATSIRAYGVAGDFANESRTRVDTNLAAYYPNICSNRWLAVRLEFVGNCIVMFAALFAVLFRNQVTGGMVGLAISYALNITQTLNWAVRMTAELETNIVSVERIKEYCDADTEAEWESSAGNKPSRDWPAKGEVAIQDLKVRYRPGTDLVLHGVSAQIQPGEKVGICGRTGAGKSSLTMVLFRIIEPAEGRMFVDGVDVTKIGLHDLRGRLTIIPQDPVLFSGTLRYNLDPFGNRTDSELWLALEKANLKAFVSGLPAKLQHDIVEGGENLSVGQRQLVCLARALLRKSSILVLDEATAAVDAQTDALVQKTIRDECAASTVLTIAHRLNTILDSDRVLVLDNGRVKEFDKPQNLLSNSDSEFYSMCKEAGLVG